MSSENVDIGKDDAFVQLTEVKTTSPKRRLGEERFPGVEDLGMHDIEMTR